MPEDASSLVGVATFLVVTALPYGWAVWLARHERRVEVRRLHGVVLGTFGLYTILHLTAFTVGLSLSRVTAVALGAGAAAWFVCRWQARHTPTDQERLPQEAPSSWPRRLTTLAMVGGGASWAVAATASLDVFGTDAAHYHLPHAVNYALGATPWDPMPTRHEYPMGTSLLFAWFMLPFGDPFVVDAAMLVPAALLVGAAAALLATLTGEEGWAWAPWWVLGLLATPLVAAAAAPSADLPYAAAFLAAGAQAVIMVTDDDTRPRAWLVLGAALGLMIASKVTGLYSAGLLALVFTGAWVWLRHGSGALVPLAPVPILRAGAALIVGLVPGLAWLVRSAAVYGHVVEPITDPYYLSIAQDLRTTYRGEWMYLAFRASRRLHQWLGAGFLQLRWLVGALAIDAIWGLARRRDRRLDRIRLAVLGSTVAIGAVHVAGMLRAPWTSLEHASGSSLRYVLPIWIAWALLALAGLFPRSVPWYHHHRLYAAAWSLLVASAVTWSWTPGHPWWSGFAAAPWVVLAIVAAIVCVWEGGAARVAVRGSMKRRWLWLAPVLVVAGAASGLVTRHGVLYQEAVRAEAADLDHRPSVAPAADDEYREPYRAVRRDESLRGLTCDARRFFMASRFDLPLALQPAAYTSLVFDSRDAGRALRVMRHRQASGTCDYAVVHRDEMSRTFITVTSAWLVDVEASGPFRVFRIVRP